MMQSPKATAHEVALAVAASGCAEKTVRRVLRGDTTTRSISQLRVRQALEHLGLSHLLPRAETDTSRHQPPPPERAA